MYEEETVGWKETIRDILVAVIQFSFTLTFLSLAWFWALSRNLITGLIVGLAAGVIVGLLYWLFGGTRDAMSLQRGCAYFGCVLMTLAIVLGVIGVVVGFVT